MSEEDEDMMQTRRLELWLPGVEEASRVAAYVTRNLDHHGPWEPPRPRDFGTTAYWERRLAQSLVEFNEGRSMRLFLKLRRGEGAIIGVTNFTNIARGPLQACTLGYSIDHAHEGRGLMREALERAISFAFDTLALHRIEANYLPTNDRSGGLLRRLGFQVEGYARDYLFIDGAWRDHLRAALTQPEPERVRIPHHDTPP